MAADGPAAAEEESRLPSAIAPKPSPPWCRKWRRVISRRDRSAGVSDISESVMVILV
jgi:hypothetical protein